MTEDQLFNKISDISSKNTAQSQEFAREEMKFNAEEAEKNRQWQADQSGSAHQREVLDLQKAGLNPVLSAGGSGAQTGSGATASGASGKVDDSVVPALTSIIVNQQNNANAQAIAQMQREATLEAARISQQTALQTAQIQAEASRFAATSSANAAYNSAIMHSQATKYAANQNYAASKFNSQAHYKATKYSANQGYKGTELSAKTSRDNAKLDFLGKGIQSALGALGRIFGR